MTQYGGSLENRARFILGIVNAIKAALPSDRFVIAAKFSCQDCKLENILHSLAHVLFIHHPGKAQTNPMVV